MTIKKFFFDGEEGNITLYTYDILGNRVDLYAINTAEEAASVCKDLNAAIQELMGEEAESPDQPSHRRNPGFCGKCGGDCEFDDEGNFIQEVY